jgi:hypothetical protein
MEPEPCGKCDAAGKIGTEPCECPFGVHCCRERVRGYAEDALKQVEEAEARQARYERIGEVADNEVTAEEEAKYDRLLRAAGITPRPKPPPSLDVHDLPPEPKK